VAARLLPGGNGVLETSLTPETDRLLEELERRACLYFFEQADPSTGLVRDRARADGSECTRIASMAATGFGLSALAIADRRRYLPGPALRRRLETTLRFLARRTNRQNGFFYHFLDSATGRRAWRCELSSVDTAWLLCGVLHAREHFATPAIDALAADIVDPVDWRWMLNGQLTLSHGWTPEHGFLPYRWDCYAELLAMYLLALGSRSHPIPAESWHAWKRPSQSFGGQKYIDGGGPLFVHQYSHAWFDFRGRRDRYTDYFSNSQQATRAHRQFCIDMARNYPWYGPDLWGVTASDSRRGYRAWGSRSSPPDGTLVPCAAGGSIAFLPEECSDVLWTMLNRYGTRVWGRYGFVDAFHPAAEWYSPDVIGINLGIMLLMAENARSGAVWQAVGRSPEAARGFDRAGFLNVG
jgi:hypothetical protein